MAAGEREPMILVSTIQGEVTTMILTEFQLLITCNISEAGWKLGRRTLNMERVGPKDLLYYASNEPARQNYGG